MESESYKRIIATEIRMRVMELRRQGQRTSKGEKMSLAAIGRTLDPPVNRVSVYNIVDGTAKSERIRKAIERELGQVYWIRHDHAA